LTGNGTSSSAFTGAMAPAAEFCCLLLSRAGGKLIGGKAGARGSGGGSQWSGGKKKRRRGFPLCRAPRSRSCRRARFISFSEPRPHRQRHDEPATTNPPKKRNKSKGPLDSSAPYGGPLNRFPYFFYIRWVQHLWLATAPCHAFRELMFGSLSNFRELFCLILFGHRTGFIYLFDPTCDEFISQLHMVRCLVHICGNMW
jgi:hypothetical protein